MDGEQIELYLELINGFIGIAIFVLTLIVFKYIRDNPNLIRSYFFLEGGKLSKPFFYIMLGMLVWGICEFYKVLEIKGIIKFELFYEVTELISASLLLISMVYFFNITKKKKSA